MPPLADFPFLADAEFAAACRSLITCQDQQHHGPETVVFRVQRGLGYLRIAKQVTGVRGVEEGPHTGVPDDVEEVVEGDDRVCQMITKTVRLDPDMEQEMLLRMNDRTREGGGCVTFDILLSPSYRVPVLYFTLQRADSSTVQDIEVIYASLVPHALRASISAVGTIGAISMADHPLTGSPSFFIHPCFTPDAMREVAAGREVQVEEYLPLWLGIVGSAVGLYAPLPAQS